MKKFWLLGMLPVFFFSCTDKDNLVSSDLQMNRTLDVKDAPIEEDALNIYETLNTSFVSTRSGSKIYPDNYGGNYLDENGNFIVLVVENKKDLKSSLIIPDGAIIKYCKYSYQELLDVMDVLVNYKPEKNEKIYDNFPVAFIDEKLNRIVVQLVDYSETAIKEFKEYVSDSDAIIFTKNESIPQRKKESPDWNIEYIPAFSETLDASKPFLAGAPFGSISIGYRAKRNGEAGLVTCAHWLKNGQNISINGNVIGTVTAWVYSGCVDACFIKLSDLTYEGSNTLYKYPGSTANGEISTEIKEYGVGFTVNKIGQTTQRTWGEIFSVAEMIKDPDDNVVFYPVTGVKYNCGNGDSGGIVYSYVSSTDTRYTVGVHKAHGTYQGNPCGYYTRANDIKDKLGVSRY